MMSASQKLVLPVNDPSPDVQPVGTVTVDDIRAIVSLAMTSPSGDNSQPWRFTWNGKSLAVFYESPRGEHALNNNHHSTYLTLGGLLEALKIAASSRNLKVKVTANLSQPEGKAIAILYFERQSMETDPDFSVLSVRQVDRRPFAKEPLTQSLKDELQVRATAFSSCQFTLIDRTEPELLSYLVTCDEFMWKNRNVFVDFLKWVHLSKKEIEQNNTGMPWPSLGLRWHEMLTFRLFRKFPSLVAWLWPLGLKASVNALSKKLVQSSGGLYCISLKSYNPQAIVDAGGLAFRLWLLLNSRGYGVQPISLASMTALDINMGFSPPGTSRKYLDHFRLGPKQLQKAFSLKNEDIPIWLFRTGLVSQPNANTRTKRLLVEEYLKIYSRDSTEP
jgi:hypothetical protein